MKKEKELLRKQMSLLSEQSKTAMEEDLSNLSNSMCEVYRLLNQSVFSVTTQLAMFAYFVVSFLILFKKLFRGKF